MGYFDSNNPQHRRLAEAHHSGDHSQLDTQQVAAAYKGFVDNTSENEVQAVHQEYFNRMPKVEQMGLFSSLIDAARQNGLDPRRAGVSTTDPHQATSFDLGNLFNLARSSGLLSGMFGGGQSQSGLGSLAGGLLGNSGGFDDQNQTPDNEQNSSGFGSLGNILNNPIAQAALSGLVGYAASKAFGGGGHGLQIGRSQGQDNQTLPGNQNLPGEQSLPQWGQNSAGEPSLPNEQSLPGEQSLPPTTQSDFRM